jgi:hypothetical protein
MKENQHEEEAGLHFCGTAIVFRTCISGNCHSQCQELRQELIKDCRDDLGPNSEQCREDQKRFQEICHDESLEE